MGLTLLRLRIGREQEQAQEQATPRSRSLLRTPFRIARHANPSSLAKHIRPSAMHRRRARTRWARGEGFPATSLAPQRHAPTPRLFRYWRRFRTRLDLLLLRYSRRRACTRACSFFGPLARMVPNQWCRGSPAASPASSFECGSLMSDECSQCVPLSSSAACCRYPSTLANY